MKKTTLRILTYVTSFAITLSMFTGLSTTAKAAEPLDKSKIVILHTNDTHCNINKAENDDPAKAYIGFTSVASEYQKAKAQYANVSLVDAGDHIQGGPIGSLTQGQAIVDLMNTVGYTVATFGNHEFDYGVNRLLYLRSQASYNYTSCNFIDLATNKSVAEPYTMVTYDTEPAPIKIAYVGITTPQTISQTASDTFKDSNGNMLYSFCQDETGDALYAKVQETIDSAHAAGADYVILLGHLGQNGIVKKWRSDTIVSKTSGAIAMIDGHSHEEYMQTVKNKNGEDVKLVQAGYYLNAVGRITIDAATGQITTEIVHAPLGNDAAVDAKISEINVTLNTILSQEAGKSECNLYALEDDNYTWAVRIRETNAADFVADAYRTQLGTDVAILGGGSVRANLQKGKLTYNDILKLQPFNNNSAIIKASGQQLLDALELGANMLPEANGGFLQVSGISYKIDISIPSTVKTDTNKSFVEVSGERRVYDVRINGEPIDPNRLYTVGGLDFTLLRGGDGFSMFSGCEVLTDCGPKDYELVSAYLTHSLNGVIGQEYADPNGQGRIIITEGKQTTADVTDTGDFNFPAIYSLILIISAGNILIHVKRSVKY